MLPKEFIGKQVEVIAFTVEEAKRTTETNINITTPVANEKPLIKNQHMSEEDLAWYGLAEQELNMMSLSYAEKSFAKDWDVNDQAENDYWNSF